MDNNRNMYQDCQHAIGALFTKKHLKQIGVIIIIGCILAGGSAFYHHKQKQAQHTKVLQAQNTMIETQATQKNITLLDQGAVRSLVAKAIGVDEGQITYREIVLLNAAQGHGKTAKHSDKKEYKNHASTSSDTGVTNVQNQINMAPVSLPSSELSTFRPIYSITCNVDSVKYRLHIDAVNGNVLQSHVD